MRSFLEIASASDFAWLAIAVVAALAAIALGAVLAVHQQTRAAWVIAAASTLALVSAPLVGWSYAQSSADQFGGGPTMIWLVMLPATRVYALFATAFAVINVASLAKRRVD